MLIQSVFLDGEPIPLKYTCVGENISPSLKFLQIPDGAKSLVLIMDDPDAPVGIVDHWIILNLPADLKELSDGAPELDQLNPKPVQGMNYYGKTHYRGPCPPPGPPHHYHFKLYALDSTLSLPEGSTKQLVEKTMEGKIIEKTELIGTFQK